MLDTPYRVIRGRVLRPIPGETRAGMTARASLTRDEYDRRNRTVGA